MEDDTRPQPIITEPVEAEQVFTPEAIDYWKQIPPDKFIDAMRHEMMNFFMPIIGYIELINEQSDLDIVLMKIGDNDFTLRHLCEVVMRQQPKVYNLRDLLFQYSQEIVERDEPNTNP